MNISVFVDATKIAGNEETIVAQLFSGLLGHLPIARKHIGPAHFQHADFALRQGRAGCRVGDDQLNP